ncbi:ATP-binding cassette domain-containing protein [Halobacteria archaeon AArc-curdl1]|uniref:ATP-binding cassette domain-containing protein n=1 Tax=Natronosalvus hydrolyticus TaxID=2979988 RepID=A0AAP2ZA89_9EURY|nr:ATP-binding cassette domain-containing protein [Halobacteria archaeon AArc-curdl1]
MEVDGMSKYFQSEGGFLASLRGAADVKAVDDVTFDIKKGETLALVGESGCGKSTLARTILQLHRPTEGSIRFKGTDLTDLSSREIRPLRQDMQMVFQDPHSSLNPRLKVGQIIEEPMKAHDMYDAAGRRERAEKLLESVGLEAAHYHRYPHEFSGGQRQRVNLARAFSTDPEIIMCDEPTSALDVSVQAQVLNVMKRLQDEFGVTYLFISHDMSVVRYVADRVAVMYLGHVAELAEKEALFENPKHPYTRALLDSIPVPDPRSTGERGTLAGDVPSPTNPPSGCRFRTRCPKLIQPGTYDVTREELADDAAGAALQSYDLDEPTWRNVIGFVRAVDRRSFTLENVEDSPDAVRAFLDERFFAGSTPSGEPADVIDDAARLLAEERWDEAADHLRTTFEEPSICAARRPAYVLEEDVEEERFVACHLYRDSETDSSH